MQRYLAQRTSLYTSSLNRSISLSIKRSFHNSFVSFNQINNNSDSNKPKPTTNGDIPAHGFDAKKPRKPLSRIAIGSTADIEREKQASTVGMLNWKSAVVFLATGFGLWWFMNREKERVTLQREAEANRGYGKPLVGGPFSLIDQNGNSFTQEDLKGHFSLIYFGFSMCPDICPEELEKMTEIIDDINKDSKKLLPIFITCDPNRDSPEVLKQYLVEFHPDIVGLTGSYEDIKQTCKHYRVYFSTPPDLKPGDEYLVDHSIFFYLMDPEGNFIDALGRNYDAATATDRIKQHMAAWMPEDQREKQKSSWLGSLFEPSK